MKKYLLAILYVSLVTIHGAAFAEEITLASDLVVDVEDSDYSYQSFPEFDLNEPTLAFWDGETIAGLVNYVGHDKFASNFSKYLEAFISDVEKGASNVEFRELRSFKSSGGLKVMSYHASFVESGADLDALYYFYPASGGFQIVMCLIFDRDGVSGMARRMDAVMETAEAM
jgi:hypothetical protein